MQAVPGRQLSIRLEYDTDVFDKARIGKILSRIMRILDSMAAEVAQR
jgi:hypothetical protein